MNSIRKLPFISIEDYLDGELVSEIRHEYVGGVAYAMTGGTGNHSRLKVRSLSLLERQLQGSKCVPYDSDFKIRIARNDRTYFYYPDASVFCETDLATETFANNPVVVVEVLSDSTRRTDLTEKCDNYLSIASLQTYIMLEQDQIKATVYQRGSSGDFEAMIYQGNEATVPLVAIGASLPLADLYRDIVTA